MNTHADKPSENKSQKVAGSLPKLKTNTKSTLQLTDNRPETVAQEKLQEAITTNPQVKQLQVYQAMADNFASQTAQRKENLETLQGKFEPIPKQENNTRLPNNLKSGIEKLSGYSMDDVKVHYNSDKPAQLQAHAYAQGTDIHLASGQEKHLPHEAWHVVQQKQGRVKPTIQMKGKVNINDDKKLEKEADVMGAKAFQIVDNKPAEVALPKLQKFADNRPNVSQQKRIKNITNTALRDNQKSLSISSEYGNAMLQMVSNAGKNVSESLNIVQFIAKQDLVIQRVIIKMGLPDLLKLKIEKHSFAAYLKKNGFSYDDKKRELNTGDAEISKGQLISDYHQYKEIFAKEESEAVVSSGEFRDFGETCVNEMFSGRKIEQLVQIGKNNFGIYRIDIGRKKPLIVKVLGPGHSEASLKETLEITNALKKRYAESQKHGKFEINALLDHKSFEKGPVKVTLAIFEEQGVMSLDDALLHQDLDIGTLVGAARGLADRTARFHFAPIAQKDVDDGQYLFHGDLNTSNLMLDFEGIMGLIDNDGLKKTNDSGRLIWDINSLLTTMREALIKRYSKDPEKNGIAIFNQMKEAFKTQYILAMNSLKVPDRGKIAEQLPK
jgi:hypothetical protein